MHNQKFYLMLILIGCVVLGLIISGQPPADASAIRGLSLREGEHIVFLSDRSTQLQVYMIDWTGDIEEITNDTFNYLGGLDCSRDSRYLVFADGFYITVYDLRGPLTRTFDDSLGLISSPALSPDNRLIVVDSRNDLVVIDSENGDFLHRLTYSPEIDMSPAWSPDGTRIAFTSRRDGNAEIYVMDIDGTNQIRLTNNDVADEYPAWSPDGTQIAFSSRRDGQSEIYVMNADGTNPVRITNHPGSNFSPSWSPDGSRIAFVSGRDGNGEIYIMNADGSDPQRLTYEPAFDGSPCWIVDD